MKPLLPLSKGLPPSGIRNEQQARDRHARKFPAKKGRPAVQHTQDIIDAIVDAKVAVKQAHEIAVATEQSITTIRSTIKRARASLQSKAEEYVELHMEGARIAAAEGNTKPTEWALERIAEGKDRIVDPPAPTGPIGPPPSLSVGILLGGLVAAPTPRAALPDAIDGETA